MPKQLTFLCLFLFAIVAEAQVDPLIVRSRTDQFVVYGFPSANSPRALNSIAGATQLSQGHLFWLKPNHSRPTEDSRIHLEPGLVAVSCERIKDALLRELGERDSGDRRIYIQLNNRIRQHQTRILADRYERGWMYALEFPVEVEEHFFNASIVQVLLYELANRNSPDQQIDLPQWLISGLISHLQANTLQSFSVQPNVGFAHYQNKVDPLIKVRQTFEKELPLNLDELSWPDTLSGSRANLFRDSAHLFVSQLLLLRDGKESMRRFIFELQHHRNWQFAFLKAYEKHFTALVEVEKWWGLNFVNFMGRDAAKLWSAEESWKQLKAALDVSASVHLDANRLPVTAEYNLQDIILNWDYSRQDMAISKAISQLRALRFRTQPELRALVDEYRKTLETYIEQRSRIGRPVSKREIPITATALKKRVCQQLDMLDEQRSKLRQEFLNAQSDQTQAPVAPGLSEKKKRASVR